MNRIKELREEAMMTVRELSERSGVSEDTITKLENGHRKGRGMTLRKLARALGTTPHQLSPEQFRRTTEAEDSALEIFPQDALFGSNMRTTKLPEGEPQDASTLGAAISRVFEIVATVEEQSGLAYQSHLERLSENQQKALLIVTQGDGLHPPAVADQLGCSVSTAYRDLAILEEHGLVSSYESGQRRPTVLGRSVADALTRGELYFDEALKHVATLAKAYESVTGLPPHRVAKEEVESFLWLQESIIRVIDRIVATAEPLPLAEEMRGNYWGREQEREGTEDIAEAVQTIMGQLMSDPPSLQIIQADIEGVPKHDVFKSLDVVLAAHRTDYGTTDPYKNFRWNLKRRSRRYSTTQQGETDSSSSQQASVRNFDS